MLTTLSPPPKRNKSRPNFPLQVEYFSQLQDEYLVISHLIVHLPCILSDPILSFEDDFEYEEY